MYKTYLLSHLEFSAALWQTTYNYHSNNIEDIQANFLSRIFNNRDYTQNLSRANLQPLWLRRAAHSLIELKKCTQLFDLHTFPDNSGRSSMTTRSGSSAIWQPHLVPIFNHLFLFTKAIQLYNNIPNDIRQTNLKKFKKEIYPHLHRTLDTNGNSKINPILRTYEITTL